MGKRLKRIFIVIAIIIIIAVISWFIFPDWKNHPLKFIGTLIAVTIAVILLLDPLINVYNNFIAPKNYNRSLIRNISIDELSMKLGYGKNVDFVNRHFISSDFLIKNKKILLTGSSGIGKTREAIELINRLINEDLLTINEIFTIDNSIQIVDEYCIENALKQQINYGERILLFIDEFPKQISSKEEKRFGILFNTLNQCKEFYLLATGKAEGITSAQKKWFAKEKIKIIPIPNFKNDEIKKFIVNATELLGLKLDDEAKDVFVNNGDGRPATSWIGLLRLKKDSHFQVDERTARLYIENSLNTAWGKIISSLENEYPPIKYWLEALYAFYCSNINPSYSLVKTYGLALFKSTERYDLISKKKFLKSFEILNNYEFEIIDDQINFPDAIFINRPFNINVVWNLKEFLMNYRKILQIPILYFFNDLRVLQSDSLFNIIVQFQEFSDIPYGFYSHEVSERHIFFTTYSESRVKYKQDLIQLINDYSIVLRINPKLIEALDNRGSIYSDLGKHDLAIKDFNHAIRINPQSFFTYFNRGASLANQKQFELAIDDFNHAISIFPFMAEVVSNRGLCYTEVGKFDLAIKDLEQAIKINPFSFLTYLNFGVFYYTSEKYEEAISYFTKSIKINPNFHQAYLNRGECFLKMKRNKLALKDFNSAIKLEPGSSNAFYKRAIYYSTLNKNDEAIRDLSTAIELDPQNIQLIAFRAEIYKKTKKLKEAIDDYDVLIKKNIKDSEVYNDRGLCLSELEKYKESINNFSHAIRINSNFSIYLFNRGTSSLYLEKYQHAIKDFGKAIKIDPRNYDAYNNCGLCFYFLKKYKRAIAEYEKVIQINPKFNKAFCNRGICLMEIGEYDLAINDFTKAIEIDPNYIKAYGNRSECFKKVKNYKNAISDLLKATELEPEEPQVYYLLSRVYALDGNINKSILYLEKVLSLDHDYYDQIKVERDFDSIRKDQVFINLLNKYI